MKHTLSTSAQYPFGIAAESFAGAASNSNKENLRKTFLDGGRVMLYVQFAIEGYSPPKPGELIIPVVSVYSCVQSKNTKSYSKESITFVKIIPILYKRIPISKIFQIKINSYNVTSSILEQRQSRTPRI